MASLLFVLAKEKEPKAVEDASLLWQLAHEAEERRERELRQQQASIKMEPQDCTYADASKTEAHGQVPAPARVSIYSLLNPSTESLNQDEEAELRSQCGQTAAAAKTSSPVLPSLSSTLENPLLPSFEALQTRDSNNVKKKKKRKKAQRNEDSSGSDSSSSSSSSSSSRKRKSRSSSSKQTRKQKQIRFLQEANESSMPISALLAFDSNNRQPIDEGNNNNSNRHHHNSLNKNSQRDEENYNHSNHGGKHGYEEEQNQQYTASSPNSIAAATAKSMDDNHRLLASILQTVRLASSSHQAAVDNNNERFVEISALPHRAVDLRISAGVLQNSRTHHQPLSHDIMMSSSTPGGGMMAMMERTYEEECGEDDSSSNGDGDLRPAALPPCTTHLEPFHYSENGSIVDPSSSSSQERTLLIKTQLQFSSATTAGHTHQPPQQECNETANSLPQYQQHFLKQLLNEIHKNQSSQNNNNNHNNHNHHTTKQLEDNQSSSLFRFYHRPSKQANALSSTFSSSSSSSSSIVASPSSFAHSESSPLCTLPNADDDSLNHNNSYNNNNLSPVLQEQNDIYLGRRKCASAQQMALLENILQSKSSSSASSSSESIARFALQSAAPTRSPPPAISIGNPNSRQRRNSLLVVSAYGIDEVDDEMAIDVPHTEISSQENEPPIDDSFRFVFGADKDGFGGLIPESCEGGLA